MPWILGIDEAGYGPNLGPFVMSGVLCRVDSPPADLWEVLAAAVRRAAGPRDDRLIVDDSKEVYNGARGLGGLERGLHALAGRFPDTFGELVTTLAAPDQADLAAEIWYTGTTPMPTASEVDDLARITERFQAVCAERGVHAWRMQSVVVCPERFNALVERHDSKGAVLGHGFIRLLAWAVAETAGEPLAVFVDKQGGRNTYAAQIHQALEGGWVNPLEESSARSRYQVLGLDRPVELTFQPRADQTYLGVALASMVSKYLRELFMGEFNAFWQKQVPGLKPTAGYPGDAVRFFDAIRAAARNLAIAENTLWRCR